MAYRKFVACLVVSCLVVLSGCQTRSPGTKPLRVLLVGNSQVYFNEGVGRMMEGLAASGRGRPALAVTELTVPGATLKAAWDYYAGIERLPTGTYDVVILQDTLGLREKDASVVAQYPEYVQKIGQWAREHGGGRTVLFMEPTYLPPSKTELPLAERDAINREVAGKVDADVAPAGIAFQRAWEQRPSLKLVGPDGEHPSRAGTYLYACVLYTTVTRSSPVGLSYVAKDAIGPGDPLGKADAGFLQKVAWEACTTYEPAHVSR